MQIRNTICSRNKKNIFSFSEQINNVNERELEYVSVFEWQVHFQHNLKFCLFYCVLNERKWKTKREKKEKALSIIIIVVAVVLYLCARTYTYIHFVLVKREEKRRFFRSLPLEFCNFKLFVVILPFAIFACFPVLLHHFWFILAIFYIVIFLLLLLLSSSSFFRFACFSNRSQQLGNYNDSFSIHAIHEMFRNFSQKKKKKHWPVKSNG